MRTVILLVFEIIKDEQLPVLFYLFSNNFLFSIIHSVIVLAIEKFVPYDVPHAQSNGIQPIQV